MKRLGVMLACALVVALPSGAGTVPEDCGDGSIPESGLAGCQQEALGAATAFLATQAPSSMMLEALAAAGIDPGSFPDPQTPAYGAVAVPANGDSIKQNVRRLAAAARTGYDPTAYPDPERGTVDLLVQLHDKAARAKNEGDDSVAAFTLLGLRGAGVPVDDPAVTDLATRLKALQSPAGGWSCGIQPNADCTGFAVAALAAAQALDGTTADRVQMFLSSCRTQDGGYGFDPSLASQGRAGNGDSTAWALSSLQLVEREAPHRAWEFLLSLQDDDGGFRWMEGTAGARAVVSAEAIIALSGGHPGRPFGDLVDLPASVHVGDDLALQAPEADTATWEVDGAVVDGIDAVWSVGRSNDLHVRFDARAPQAIERGTWTVEVRNDPPAFPSLPENIVTDRIQGIAFDAGATDPEGFPVDATWSLGPLAGDGPVDALPDTPGTYGLGLHAADPHGGVAEAAIDVLVRNLRPTIERVELPERVLPEDAFDFRVHASDPEADGLTYTWRFTAGSTEKGSSGAQGTLTLAEGTYRATVRVKDAYGASAAWTGDLIVADEAPRATPPAITAAHASLEGRDLNVTFEVTPADAEVWATWVSGERHGTVPLDDGQGRASVPTGLQRIDQVVLGARHDGMTVERSWGPFELPPLPAPADLPTDAVADGEQGEQGDGDAGAGTAGASENVTTQDRESPIGPLVPMLSLAAALGMRARRAPRRL